MPTSLHDTFSRLVTRDNRRTEAEIQADVRQFILDAPFELEEDDLSLVQLESQLGDRRRIDVEVGATVIEVKRDLRSERVRRDAEVQLAGYVGLRADQTGLRYVGILTDGTGWYCYHLVDQELRQVSDLSLEAGDIERLVVWLEGVLATTHGLVPTADAIEARLGSTSSAYLLDRATISAIYQRNRHEPSVIMKRTLWARLLTSALGTQFDDSDDLFIEHTLLVNSAEIIAHAVLGLHPETITPVALLGGERFDESGIYGVVEPDFFDWVVEIEEGRVFVRTLSRRLARFDWSAVEQDVLKVLYESIIGAETRKRLGEYYTPDWLAHIVIEASISEPLTQRVLDAACGSGTFLFHAIRRYVAAAEDAGMTVSEQINGVTRHVIGMDLHPVAVTLARVTYLLAIGRDRLINPERSTIQIPVYLGDSLQWQEQSRDLWSAGNLTIHADDNRELVPSELRFPDALLDDAARFDELVNELANRAANRRPGSAIPSLNSVFQRLAVPQQHRAVVEGTFRTMCRLHDEGRDHIWGYYVRNLARPMWLAREANRVDVLVGNPPWLAYRNMTDDMQLAFRRMSEARGLWAGGELATQQDLAGLFAVRACELYLRNGGSFGLVLPNTAIDRDHYAGFRSGRFGDATVGMAIAFSSPWDLRRIRPHFFPRASSVVFGVRADGRPRSMPEEAEIWTGRLPAPNAHWEQASIALVRTGGRLRRNGTLSRSPYAAAFSQGPNFSPHFMFNVEHQPTTTLGIPAGRTAIRSCRSIHEKRPWRSLDGLSGVVESEFVRPSYNGDSVFPYRAAGSTLVVLPCGRNGPLSEDQIELSPGLHQWWNRAKALWEENKSTDGMSLMQRINYQSGLAKQFPIPEIKVVYNRAGMHLVAAKITDRRAVIANGLYWASVRTGTEADFLCTILNAPVTTDLARPLMSYGKDERDIHKHVWELPIPPFDETNPVHVRLAELGAAAEQIAASFAIDPNLHFAATRRHIRQLIEATPEGREINDLVYELIS
ncbi:N-6 DNA methylase (plasmid) [Sinorhizobium meliloti]|uniref:N-6 DNA methylase n=1 Tax=Rhizobium meliloti TaxID=382 RepID=UPI000FD9F490|nr:N-6 DNA methylase [Sinorhizobium meliloti]MDX1115864.1 N-6 DNA methylase [Sinorhizobium medicae]QPI27877.1 N-6 DNA methylase [Sinorhizobium meliloti]RVK61768.1 SAM-dependent DNA methyltransferase [Sinorhizobium meliloti]